MRGTIDYINKETDCGFISSPESDQDVLFVGKDGRSLDLEVDSEVEFQIVQTMEGVRAKSMQAI
jgi:CspA family cold shock protein